jgi:chemotaxis protein CheD
MSNKLTKILLHPGDFAFVEPGVHIHTLLGSCISITLWHPQLHIGGMCHFMLPERPSGHPKGKALDGRYGDEAMMLFQREAAQHRTQLSEYQAKIFGGGNMIVGSDDINNSIGAKNSEKAMQLLMGEGVDVLVAHVGEFGHRRIFFDIDTGDVWVRHHSLVGQRRLNSLNGKT